jgi:hypothetical protein
MPWPVVLWALLGPPAAAAAGALSVYLAHRGRCEQLQDRAYEQGWRDGRDKAEAFSGSMVPEPATITSIRPPGARHEGPTLDSPAVIAHLALADVAGEFDRIRQEFGLGPIEGPAGSEAAQRAYPADIPGPPSGELLRAAGIVPGPPWPIAPRRE